MSLSRDLLAELELTMVPGFRPDVTGQAPPGGFPDAPAAEGSRRRQFWCELKEVDVEVEFATRSFLGLSRTVGVRQCTAFDEPHDVACGRECLDSRFRGKWPPALPIMGRGKAREG
jgi:hypothetical protein